MNTKEVCRKLSVTPKMLRVYETQKLISPVRCENNYRDYSIEDILKIQIIMVLRDLGFSLREISSVLDFNKSENDYLHSFYIQSKAIESKINELNNAKDRLNGAINELLRTEGKEVKITEAIFPSGKDNEKTIYQEMVDRWNFDLMAVDYVNRYLKEDIAYLNSIRAAQSLIRKFPPDTRMLDIGGGTCNLWSGFGPATLLTVLDKSLPMILAAKESAPWARYIMDDILKLDTRKYDCFDLVLSTFTLHHIQSDMQQIAIQNMIGLSCPKGSVLIIDRSFRDRRERDAREKMLIEKGDQEALDIFHSEFYPIVEDVVRLVRGLGRQIEAFPVEENIWGYRIY